MACFDADAVADAMKNRICAVRIGPYRVEYINDAGPYLGTESEHLAILERGGGVTDIVDIDSTYFQSLVTEYGATGEQERYT